METRNENKFFWPLMAAIAVIFALRNLSRRSRVAWPPHIVCLLAYLSLPERACLFLASHSSDLLNRLWLLLPLFYGYVGCPVRGHDARSVPMLHIRCILNCFFLFGGYQTFRQRFHRYSGYFSGKNYLVNAQLWLYCGPPSGFLSRFSACGITVVIGSLCSSFLIPNAPTCVASSVDCWTHAAPQASHACFAGSLPFGRDIWL
jgi:hypothetical protein